MINNQARPIRLRPFDIVIKNQDVTRIFEKLLLMNRLIFIFLFLTGRTFAQELPDPRDIYTEDGRKIKKHNSYHPVETALFNGKTLLKFGGSVPLVRQSSFTGTYAGISLDALIEQKLYQGLTLFGGVENNVGFSLDGRGAQLYSLEMPIALRYYFSLTRKEKMRPDRHSFFSNYIAIQAYNVLFSNLTYPLEATLYDLQRYKRGTVTQTITNSGSVGDKLLLLNYAVFQIGTQHRVFSKCYLDVNVVVPVSPFVYNRYDFTLATPPFINIKLGVGLWK